MMHVLKQTVEIVQEAFDKPSIALYTTWIASAMSWLAVSAGDIQVFAATIGSLITVAVTLICFVRQYKGSKLDDIKIAREELALEQERQALIAKQRIKAIES